MREAIILLSVLFGANIVALIIQTTCQTNCPETIRTGLIDLLKGDVVGFIKDSIVGNVGLIGFFVSLLGATFLIGGQAIKNVIGVAVTIGLLTNILIMPRFDLFFPFPYSLIATIIFNFLLMISILRGMSGAI